MIIEPYKEVPERCVKFIDDLAGKAEIRIEMTGEDMRRLPSYITSTYNEETDTRGIIIPSEWTELIMEKLPFTVYGFEHKDIEFARSLIEAGITPFELKEHYHDFEWVNGILRKGYEKQIQNAFDNCVGGLSNEEEDERY